MRKGIGKTGDNSVAGPRRTLGVALLLCGALLLSACTPQTGREYGASQPQTQSSSVAEPAPAPAPVPESEPTQDAPAAPVAEVFYPLPDEVAQRITGVSWTQDAPVTLQELAYLALPYIGFDGESYMGEMVVHHTLAAEVAEIFGEIYDAGVPIGQMLLIDDFGADDMLSMEANNSSCFCARLILGTSRFSVHSYGGAIDINPVQNPYVTGAEVYPAAAAGYMDRQNIRPGMVTEGDVVYTAFVSRGWRWGGHWQNPDYQHFEKDVV